MNEDFQYKNIDAGLLSDAEFAALDRVIRTPANSRNGPDAEAMGTLSRSAPYKAEAQRIDAEKEAARLQAQAEKDGPHLARIKDLEEQLARQQRIAELSEKLNAARGAA